MPADALAGRQGEQNRLPPPFKRAGFRLGTRLPGGTFSGEKNPLPSGGKTPLGFLQQPAQKAGRGAPAKRVPAISMPLCSGICSTHCRGAW